MKGNSLYAAHILSAPGFETALKALAAYRKWTMSAGLHPKDAFGEVGIKTWLVIGRWDKCIDVVVSYTVIRCTSRNACSNNIAFAVRSRDFFFKKSPRPYGRPEKDAWVKASSESALYANPVFLQPSLSPESIEFPYRNIGFTSDVENQAHVSHDQRNAP